MNKIHLTLQSKGGIGKSLVATMLAQFLNDEGRSPICFDTDPANATFTQVAALSVQRIELQDAQREINVRAFDPMMEKIMSEDRDFVIDNGSGSFVPLTNYLVQNGVFEMLADAGKEVYVHTVVTGGPSLLITLQGLEALASQLPPSVKLIVWKNEFFGEVVGEGKSFEEMSVYKRYKERIAGIIRIRAQNASTFGEDMKRMLGDGLTFEEVASSEAFGLMARQRLSTVRRYLWDQMRAVL